MLWSRSYTPAFTSIANTASSPVNALIREAFIEGKVQNEETGFERDGYNIRWTVENGFGLVFVVSSPLLGRFAAAQGIDPPGLRERADV